MIELQRDPDKAKVQMAFLQEIQSHRNALRYMDKSPFQSDPFTIANNTINALKEQLVIWEEMLERFSNN